MNRIQVGSQDVRSGRWRFPGRAAAVVAALGLAACSGASGGLNNSASNNKPDDHGKTIALRVVGWPFISGLGVTAGGKTIRASRDGSYEVPQGSSVTFFAGDLELTTVPAAPTVGFFDLVEGRSCDSGPALGRLASALFALDLNNGVGGVALPAASGKGTQRLADLDEAPLMAAELAAPAGRSLSLQDALVRLDQALDAESWSENLPARTQWTNDFYELSRYLDRVIGQLALGGDNAPAAFGSATLNEVFANPTAFRTQGLVYSGDKIIFPSRYALQITDSTYLPLKTVPWAIPLDIFQAQVAGAFNPFNPDFTVNTSHDFDGLGHIGDVDLWNGKVYAPIEDENVSPSQNAFIALFNAADLSYTGEKHQLPLDKSVDGVPWVAVDGARGLIYTSEWDPVPVLHVWDLATFAFVKDVALIWPKDGNGNTVTLKRIQGAKLKSGMLYAHADTKETANPQLNTKTKRVWKIDPVTGYVAQLLTYDMPNRSEAEGLAFGDTPEGELHLLVLGPYDSAFSDAGYELSGDDWNADSTLRHYRQTASSLRDQLCGR